MKVAHFPLTTESIGPHNQINSGFNFKDHDWEGYASHRPPYLPAFYSLIYEHHLAHSNGVFGTALDVGAGAGIATRELLSKFSHVTLSDPNPLYVAEACGTLSQVPSSRISFLTGSLETIKRDDLPKGLVDLITAGMCLMWADDRGLMEKAARLLKPGGTFAAWIYAGIPVFAADEHGNAVEARILTAWDMFQERWGKLFDDKIEKGRKKNYDSEASIAAKMSARLDFLGFSKEEWATVRRVDFRPEAEMTRAFESSPVANRVDKSSAAETRETLADRDLMWRVTDWDGVKAYVLNLIAPLDVEKNAKKEFDGLREAIGKTRIRLEWPFTMVLATRK